MVSVIRGRSYHTDVCSSVYFMITLVSVSWRNLMTDGWVVLVIDSQHWTGLVLDNRPVNKYFGSSSSSTQLPRRQMNRPTLLPKLRLLGPTRSPTQPWKESRMRQCQVDWSTRWVMSCHMSQNQWVIVSVILFMKIIKWNANDVWSYETMWWTQNFRFLSETFLCSLKSYKVTFEIFSLVSDQSRCVFSPS